jgi:hypothetical protein
MKTVYKYEKEILKLIFCCRDGDSTAPAQANFPTQPMMMTFKNFLAQQDDSIDDEEAVKKYAAYKMEFKKEQLSKFFAEHKGEEW